MLHDVSRNTKYETAITNVSSREIRPLFTMYRLLAPISLYFTPAVENGGLEHVPEK